MHTQANDDLVGPFEHFVVVVPPIQLGERGQPRGAHPVLEVLVATEVGGWVGFGVATWKALHPVGRGKNDGEIAVASRADGGRGVLLGFSWPGDAR